MDAPTSGTGLDGLLTRLGLSNAAAGRRLGVSRSAVSRGRRGLTTPQPTWLIPLLVAEASEPESRRILNESYCRRR